MSDDFNRFNIPNGFSSFIDMLHFQQSIPLLGINTMGRRVNTVEMNAYIERRIAEFRRAESKADKVALELAVEEQLEKAKEISEMEKKERKSERKRRQRHRRKLRKVESSDKTENSEEQENEKKQEAEEEFDLNSAFVSNLAGKVLNKKQIPKNNTSQSDRNEEKNKILISDEQHPVTELAFEGYNLAKEGSFNEAIDKFSEALCLAPNDYRLYANRCLCFLQISQYQNALEDSENCVKYAPDYSKGYFRMGEAYLGLNDFPSAEKAFEHVLKLDPSNEEAMNDLIFMKIKKLMEMGFSKEKAISAIQKVKSLTAAADYLLRNSNDSEDEENTNISSQFKDIEEGELFQSDEEDESFSLKQEQNAAGYDYKYSEAASNISSTVVSDHTVPKKDSVNPYMDPNNPYHCTKLYIGDVSSRIKKKLLELTFSRFGDLISVTMLPSDRCAIITFRDWKGCGPAMERLQNWSLLSGTPPISIQYPTSELQKLAGGSLPLNKSESIKSNFSINDDIHTERDDWCSQTMPPPSPAPSLSSVRSTYSQAVLRSPQRRTKVDPLRDPSNPLCASLYVGNIMGEIKEIDLLKIFSKYGPVVSVRILPEKHCAFVNYKNNKSAGLAMSNLHGKPLFPHTPPVNIKYPSKAVISIAPRAGKSTEGQVIGDECYKWRTSGCALGSRCPNKHIPEHKGVALHYKTVRTQHSL